MIPGRWRRRIPGLIAAISVSVGNKVNKGDKLLMMEAMKMQATVTAPIDGVVDQINVVLGETVESKDLLDKIAGVSAFNALITLLIAEGVC